jgi:hypothetical protein
METTQPMAIPTMPPSDDSTTVSTRNCVITLGIKCKFVLKDVRYLGRLALQVFHQTIWRASA